MKGDTTGQIRQLDTPLDLLVDQAMSNGQLRYALGAPND